MSKPFRQVVSLWLNPDFTAVELGLAPLPYVNHDEVDFEALGLTLAEHFQCPERVRIRIANDTIDQVTLRERYKTRSSTGNCDDFAQALFDAARGKKPVIDVRKRWSDLHVLKERDHAPPPIVLMLVVEGTFESVMLWFHQTSLSLGIRAADIEQLDTLKPEDFEGRLSIELADQLHKSFGVPYQPYCLFGRAPAHSPLPAWMGDDY